MKIPIALKLRKGVHKQIAYAQDMMIEEVYKEFPKAVLHGGTAIWRCYNGNRFSEDIDLYINKNTTKIEQLFANLKRRGFSILRKKIKENSLFSALEFSRVEVRLEAIFKSSKYILKEYETADGLLVQVYSLEAEEMLKEKINAYLKRWLIRDLYDIFFLLRHVKEKKKVINDLSKLLKHFKQPEDENLLKLLIITGIVPNSKEMISYITKWAK